MAFKKTYFSSVTLVSINFKSEGIIITTDSRNLIFINDNF